MGKKYRILSADEKRHISHMYRYRLMLLNEASQYTIVKLAERFGSHKNTIWSLVKYMELEMDLAQSYSASLEVAITEAESGLDQYKRDLYRIEVEASTMANKIKTSLVNFLSVIKKG